jgi:cob(I)alamin adenosyltransferase
VAILKKGIVQIYTGNGKGKTTAALGLACRMLGRGGKVYICQFLKPARQETGETVLAERFRGQLVLERSELDWDMHTSEHDAQQVEQMRLEIKKQLAQIRQLVRLGEFDLVILDEITLCLNKQLAHKDDMWAILKRRAPHVELVLTGRDADEALIAQADLVTCMEEIKHPFAQGVTARPGIEY